jgi:2-polyprenyl-3-methyl-5-hydroxy-6-metoxy-1,4-benzoquinol methylase
VRPSEQPPDRRLGRDLSARLSEYPGRLSEATDRAERKRAEEDYPLRAEEEEGHLQWLREKPFGNTPRETARLLIDFGYVVRLLELQRGMSLCELGCGSGWMSRFAARHGLDAEGYDISPRMIEIAREQAAAEGIEARFEVADMEELDLGRRFDACLLYDTLHHSPRPDLVFRSAYRALRPGGRILLAEPNWAHRFRGRGASDRYGTTELGYTPRALKRLLRRSGFRDVQRFHGNRGIPFGNSFRDVFWHFAEPLAFRLLAPFWTQVWLRATAE